MPHWKCRKCHHEWDYSWNGKCDWCGTDKPRVLEEQTALEKFCRSGRLREIVDFMTKARDA